MDNEISVIMLKALETIKKKVDQQSYEIEVLLRFNLIITVALIAIVLLFLIK